MAVGNTFGATALSSYGGFWLSFAIVLTPGGFEIAKEYEGTTSNFDDALGIYLMVSFPRRRTAAMQRELCNVPAKKEKKKH